MRTWLSFALIAFPLCAVADEFDGRKPLTTDQIAQVKAEQEMRRQEIIDKSKGDDSYDGIHAARRAMRSSLQDSLDAHGVDKTQYMHELTHADSTTRAEIEEKVKEIKAQKQAEKEATADPPKPIEATPPSPPKPVEPEEGGPEIVRGFAGEEGADGKMPSIKVPSRVDANGERIPEIILGFDEESPPGGATEPKGSPAPVPLQPGR